VLVGSSSFADSAVGRFNDLTDYHKNSHSLFAKLNVKRGYYYVGVKNILKENSSFEGYKISYQNISKD